jgi:hypothetical protein
MRFPRSSPSEVFELVALAYGEPIKVDHCDLRRKAETHDTSSEDREEGLEHKLRDR